MPWFHPGLLGVHEAAEILGVSTRTVYGMVKGGRVPFLRIGRGIRFRVADLDEWATQQTDRRRRR